MNAAEQRKRLKKAFDVIGGLEGVANEADLIDDRDLQAAVEHTAETTSRELSARERAMLRRKSQGNRTAATAPTGVALKWELPEGEALLAAAEGDNVVKTLLTLRSNVLNATWTVRHGALLGIKSLLALSGVEWNDLLLAVVARDALSVLVLDRFADFVGDQTVAPVRETAAQVLTLVFTQLAGNQPARQRLWEASLEMAQHPEEWQVRHSGLLCVKYLSAVDAKLLMGDGEDDSQRLLALCLEGCDDFDEDIRSMSVELIGRLVTTQGHRGRSMDREQMLDKIMALLQSSSSSNNNNNNDKDKDNNDDAEIDEGEVGVATLVNALELIKVLSPTGDSSLKIVWRLLGHLRNASSSVRAKVLHVLATLELQRLEADDAVLVFRMLVQNVLLEDQVELQRASMQIAERLVLQPGPLLLSSYVALCTILLAPLTEPFDPRNFVFADAMQANGKARLTSVPAAHEIGFKAADIMVIKETAVIEARRRAARLVAQMGRLYDVPIHQKIAAARIRHNDAFSRTCGWWIFGASMREREGDEPSVADPLPSDLWHYREWCARLASNEQSNVDVEMLKRYMGQEDLSALQEDASLLATRVGKKRGVEEEVRVLLESLLDDATRKRALPVLVRAFPEGIPSREETWNGSLAESLAAELVNVHVMSEERLSKQLWKSDASTRQLLVEAILKYPADSVENSLASDVLLVGVKKTLVSLVGLFVECLLPMLKQAGEHRVTIVRAVRRMFGELADELSAMAAVFVVPILGRAADAQPEVRRVASELLGTLLRLVPLSGCKLDPALPEALLTAMKEAHEFLAHFMGDSLEDLRQGGGRRALAIPEHHVPVEIRADLRPYQRAGINWLAFLARYGLHGALCDDMGLGKTLQTIAVIASDHHSRTVGEGLPRMASLVVCPASLVGHWEHEVQQYAPSLGPPLVYAGTTAERKTLWRRLEQVQVVITSYETLRGDIVQLSPLGWNWVVLDEGHVIKNPKTKLTMAVKSLKAEHRLVLSGTPIQNNVVELWSLFDFLMPGLLGTESEFMERYGRAIMAVQPHVASHGPSVSGTGSRASAQAGMREFEEAERKLQALHKQVLPFLLRRMKEDVLKDLPPKIIQDYECEPSEIQRMLYEDLFGDLALRRSVVASANDGAASLKAEPEDRHVFQALQYLRKVCVHPKLVLTDDHPQQARVVERLRELGTSMDDLVVAPKLALLKELLEECGLGGGGRSEEGAIHGDDLSIASLAAGHRVLLFAQQKSSLDLVEEIVFKRHLPLLKYLRLDGSVEQRLRFAIAKQFNEDPSISVLLLTTSVGGLGLNLTGADTVIFLEHDWNPMRDLQAMDRAHRLGQRRVVTVYRLVVRNTLEQQILGLQNWKRRVAATIVQQQELTSKEGVRLQSQNLLDLLGHPTVAGSQDDVAAPPTHKRKKTEDSKQLSSWLKKHGALLEADPSSSPEPSSPEQAEYAEAFNVDSFVQSLGITLNKQ